MQVRLRGARNESRALRNWSVVGPAIIEQPVGYYLISVGALLGWCDASSFFIRARKNTVASSW